MALKPTAREKGMGKTDASTPDGKVRGSTYRGAKPSTGMPDRAEHHTGGRQHFQAEHGRQDMPGVPYGSRSLQGE